jgi:ArsR family transcriptional regulator
MTGRLPLLRALADPSRLRIVALVRDVELAVGELALVLGQSQPRISRHVRILAQAGLVTRHKEGAWVFLTLAPDAALRELLARLDHWPHDPGVLAADRAALDRVRAEREAAARAWFAAHASEWDSLRALHVPEAAVETAICQALGEAPLGRLVDVGTGTGRMLELLGPRASALVGLDNSPEMLRLARAKLLAAGLGQSEVRLADMADPPLPPASADTVVLHQALHFAHDPARVIAACARLLAPGGRLLIVDFAAHREERLRTELRHARLGFSDRAMRGWFEAAGLAPAPTRALKGGRLTVCLWLAARAPLRMAA